MGVMQQGINQLINTTGLALRLDPAREERSKALSKLKEEEKFLLTKKEELGVGGNEDRLAEIAEERAAIHPTQKNIEAAYDRSSEAMYADINREKKEKAEARAQAKAQAQLEQQQRFNEFVNLFTDGGKYK